MKKYLVIGNPISHSLSPKLHNHWFKINKIDAIYEKKQIKESDIKEIISNLRNEKIHGVNVTVPFKQSVIPFMDELSLEAKEVNSVNTIYKEKNKIIGHNTDIVGFELAIRAKGYDIKNKNIFILGAGGVVPSIISSLKKLKVNKIILSNRTRKRAENLKKIFTTLEVVDWGTTPDFDMIINATSLGLNNSDIIDLDYVKIGSNKIFYDVIYNPKQTNFLERAKQTGNKFENGKMMFIYQAHQSFTIWNKVMPKIDDETIKMLDND